MASGILYANGLDFDGDLGMLPVSIGGMLGAPSKALGILDIPGLPGTMDSGITPRESTRTLEIRCMVQALSQTALTTTLDVAKEAIGTGLVEIRGPYSTSRAYYGVLVGCTIDPFTPMVLNGWATVAMQFLCVQPYAVALTPDTISFGSTAVSIPLGTASSQGRDGWSAIIEITGAATTPTLSYLDAAGTVIGTMVFTYSPAAGDTIRIDTGRRLVQRRVSGTWSNAFSFVTAGYTWPALNIGDGSYASATYPQLKVSSGSGVITSYKHYR